MAAAVTTISISQNCRVWRSIKGVGRVISSTSEQKWKAIQIYMRHRSLTHGRYSIKIFVPGPAVVSEDFHDFVQPVHTKGQCSGSGVEPRASHLWKQVNISSHIWYVTSSGGKFLLLIQYYSVRVLPPLLYIHISFNRHRSHLILENVSDVKYKTFLTFPTHTQISGVLHSNGLQERFLTSCLVLMQLFLLAVLSC